MKKLITLISTKGKTREQIKKEAVKQLKKKGHLKNSEEKEEEFEITFIPTLS